MRRRVAKGALYVAIGIAVAVASITSALLLTPRQEVHVAGQTVAVGTTAPSLSLSGPAELDLFGQHFPTVLRFDGPIRPRLVLTHITVGSQLSSLFANSKDLRRSEHLLGQALAGGWTRYFAWEIVIAGAVSLVLVGALCGWLRLSWRRTLLLCGLGLLFTEAINLGAVMITAYSAPARLAGVSSLEALVGRAPLAVVAPVAGPPDPTVHAVVIGDSTAAGVGNTPLARPSERDIACGRSADTYAADLAEANAWRVLNLACSGATVPAGLLGPQPAGSIVVPPQLSLAKKATKATVVIVSVGADDLHWSSLLQLCAATKTCDNQAMVAYFQSQLAQFTPQYYELLKQLAVLPSHPRVLINLYYNPFDPTRHCLDHVGLTPSKQKDLIGLLDALNSVLAQGARASSFTSVAPSFVGHAICDPDPYVQGLGDAAPFHPTAAGELEIALADERALEGSG